MDRLYYFPWNIDRPSSQLSLDFRQLRKKEDCIILGAQWLKTASELCKIECDDGENYVFPAGLPAQLIEINENLVHSPNLLTDKPHTEGYIAIVLPKLKEYEYVMKRLSTEEAYKEARPDIT
ncbi:protein Simiate-like [Mizuhopecten yessoensis]|uniref:protein Simiate-like n=1 Tax=Mizuhopecten yessoensis TaxID=6573 RepID=UPI000B45EA0B|nr:protein Simiate-like [Mizuhopecten yessoensis]